MLVENVNSNPSCTTNSKAINCGMGKKNKIELNASQIEDAARLLAIFDEKIKPNKSQIAFGADSGIGSQGMVWQYLHARTPLNYDAVIKFSEAMGVKVKDISPTLWLKMQHFFYSQSKDERVLLTEEQKEILQLLEKMTPEARDNWIANGKLITSVIHTAKGVDTPQARPVDLLPIPDLRKEPARGPQARLNEDFSTRGQIRGKDLLPDEIDEQKRKSK